MRWLKAKVAIVSTGAAAVALTTVAFAGGAVASGLDNAAGVGSVAAHVLPMCGGARPCNQ